MEIGSARDNGSRVPNLGVRERGLQEILPARGIRELCRYDIVMCLGGSAVNVLTPETSIVRVQ